MTSAPTIFRIAAVILLCASARAAVAQTTITLLDQATLTSQADGPDGSNGSNGARPIHVSDVARLDGPDAESSGALILSPSARKAAGQDGLLTVSVTDVRLALDGAAVNWGRIALSGSSCTLHVGESRPPERRVAGRTPAAKPVALPIDDSGPASVRTLIASRLAEHYGVDLADLRLAFDPADESLLALPVAGRRVELEPGASPGSPRIPVNVLIYDGERLTLQRVVSVAALVQRSLVSAKSIIDRATTITADLVSVQSQWVAPGGKAAATIDQVVGAVAASRINAGQTIAQSDITTPIVVKRGEIVYVHALSGNALVKAKARALGPARDGELVQLKLDGSDAVFTARMSGRGQAVLVVPGPGEDPRGPDAVLASSDLPGTTRIVASPKPPKGSGRSGAAPSTSLR